MLHFTIWHGISFTKTYPFVVAVIIAFSRARRFPIAPVQRRRAQLRDEPGCPGGGTTDHANRNRQDHEGEQFNIGH